MIAFVKPFVDAAHHRQHMDKKAGDISETPMM